MKSSLWLLEPLKRGKFVFLLPYSSGYWLAVTKNGKLLVPSPKGDWQSFIVDEKHEQLVNKGDIVVEVGACVGGFTLSIASKAMEVIAIEPEPKNLACLYTNVKKYKNVKVVGKAAWSSKGTKVLQYTSTITGHTLVPTIGTRWKPLIKKYIKVQTDTLDNILADYTKVDVLMINTEGAELEILKGSNKTLMTLRMVVVTCHEISTLYTVHKFLEEKGFKVFINIITGTVYAEKSVYRSL